MRLLKFGHMIIEKNGKACKCGSKGCFETYASMRAFKEAIKCKTNVNSITGEKLYEIIKSGQAKDVVDEFLESLSYGLVSLINIFESDAICIGGSFVHFEDLLIEPLKEKLHSLKKFNEIEPEIVTAKMGNDAGMIGATILE